MIKKIYFSFPIQLLILNLKKNQVLLFMWLVLFLIASGNFGSVLGIPYLFLDPEYLNEVSFWSFSIVGVALGGFTMAFHISCYILDGFRFPFLGTISKPFTKFSINNSIIPISFIVFYIFQIVNHQQDYELNTEWGILLKVLGLIAGFVLMQFLLYTYFWFTNKDIFIILAENVEKRIRKLKITRVTQIKRIKDFKKSSIKVSYYLNLKLQPKKADFKSNYHFPDTISKVFDQNHLNSVLAEATIFVVILLLGIFRDNPYFQIPAAASGILSATIFLMITGAISYWFRGWSISFSIVLLLIINSLIASDLLTKKHYAHGLNYETEPKRYHVEEIRKSSGKKEIEEDRKATLQILENWKTKTKQEKPKMILFCTSGGGQRSSLWTLKVMQELDKATDGRVFEHTALITGASGGLVGAAYYRELKLREQLGEEIDPLSKKHLINISNDMLNPIIFSLLVNDILIRYQSFEYQSYTYPKDRGYSFEKQLDINTGGVLNKTIYDYYEPEQQALIPMLLLSPTSINDGRKLFISPQKLSYLSNHRLDLGLNNTQLKLKGIDFMRFFEEQDAKNLSFLTALRMSATFPYVTPNVEMPSEPPMKLMDAGLADNFGIADAILFLHVFQDWITENTSGVLLISARDSYKENKIEKELNPTLFQKIFTPITNVYNNWTYVQDIRNDITIQYAKTWFEGDLDLVHFEYGSSPIVKKNTEGNDEFLKELAIKRASLSWRLTGKEKEGIINTMNEAHNQESLKKVKKILKTVN